MIRAAELRSVLTDVDKISTAVNTFRIKYNALPGDMLNATDYWSTASGGCPTGSRTGTETCNGNGNGFLDWSSTYSISSGNDTSAAANYELFLFWQHLANAQLINGQYTGITGSGSGHDAVVGSNVMASRIANAGYTVGYFHDYTDIDWFPSKNNVNLIMFGSTWSNTETFGPTTISSFEVMSMDQKVDDGLPATGKITTMTSNFYSCVTTTNPATAVYNSANPGQNCSILFLRPF